MMYVNKKCVNLDRASRAPTAAWRRTAARQRLYKQCSASFIDLTAFSLTCWYLRFKQPDLRQKAPGRRSAGRAVIHTQLQADCLTRERILTKCTMCAREYVKVA